MQASRTAGRLRHVRTEQQAEAPAKSWDKPDIFVRPANENAVGRRPQRRPAVSRVPYYYATVMSLVWISAVAILTVSSISSLAQLAPGVAGLTFLSIAAIAVLPPMVMVAVAGSHVRGQVMMRASEFIMRETARLTSPVDVAEDRIEGLYAQVADSIDALLASLDDVVKQTEGVDRVLREQAAGVDSASETASERLRAAMEDLELRKEGLEETGSRVTTEIETLLSRMENSAGRVANLLEGSSAVFNGIELRTNDASAHLEDAITRAHSRTEGFALSLRHQVETVERLNGTMSSSLENVNAGLTRQVQELNRAGEVLQTGADTVASTISHAVNMVSATVESLRENSAEAAKSIAGALDKTWDEAAERLDRGVNGLTTKAREVAEQATGQIIEGARTAATTIAKAAETANKSADSIRVAATEAVRVVEVAFEETCTEATAVLRKGVGDITASGTATVQQAISDVLHAAETAATTLEHTTGQMTASADTVRQTADRAAGEIRGAANDAARIVETVMTDMNQRTNHVLASGVAALTDNASMASRQAVDAILRDTGEAANAIAGTIQRIAGGVDQIRDAANTAAQRIDEVVERTGTNAVERIAGGVLAIREAASTAVHGIEESMSRTTSEAQRSVQATANTVTTTAALAAQRAVDDILKTAHAAGDALEGCASESVERMNTSAVKIRDSLEAAIRRSVSEVERSFSDKSEEVRNELGSIITAHASQLELVGREAAAKLLGGQQEVVAVFEAAPRAFRDIVDRAVMLVQQGSEGARAEVLNAISVMEQTQSQLRNFIERLPIEFSTAVDTSLAGFRGTTREVSRDVSELLAANSEKLRAETREKLERVVTEHQQIIESATENLVSSLGNGPGQLYEAAATIVQQLNGVAGRIHASFESVRSQYLAQVDNLAADLERRVAENLKNAMRGS